MLINRWFLAILCFGHFNIQKGSKTYFQIRSCGEDKIPKRTDINNLRNLHCITLLVKTCFSRYCRVIFGKKSFGQKFNHTGINQKGRGTGPAY